MALSQHKEHQHQHHHSATRGALMRVISTVIIYFGISLTSGMIANETTKLWVYVIAYIIIGFDILYNAVKGIIHGDFFDENFLMTVATIGVFALELFEGNSEYGEALAVMMFFQIGEFFQGYASQRSMNKIRSLGHSDITLGESHSEAFIRRFARVYTPFVCAGALILALIPPLFNIIIGNSANWNEWIYRALTFLVISCPCALVISIPMTFFAAIIGASKKGIYIADGCCLESIDKGIIEDNDVIFENHNEENLALVKRIARKCMSIIWQNITFAIGVKVIVLILSMFGITNMWLAVFADTGIMVLAVLNAMRAMIVK